jgi:transposase
MPGRAGRTGEEVNPAPTNHVAERTLRPAVLWRKGSFGSDSEAGSRFAERLLTVVASCRQQERPLLAFLVAAREGRGAGQPIAVSAPGTTGGLNGYQALIR